LKRAPREVAGRLLAEARARAGAAPAPTAQRRLGSGAGVWQLFTMSNATLPDALRPLVHQEVDALDDVGLETVHRVILRMRLAQSLERLDGMADEKHAKGVMERLPEIIAEVRARRRAQA
jgi:hypothetical protein